MRGHFTVFLCCQQVFPAVTQSKVAKVTVKTEYTWKRTCHRWNGRAFCPWKSVGHVQSRYTDKFRTSIIMRCFTATERCGAACSGAEFRPITYDAALRVSFLCRPCSSFSWPTRCSFLPLPKREGRGRSCRIGFSVVLFCQFPATVEWYGQLPRLSIASGHEPSAYASSARSRSRLRTFAFAC